MNDTPTPRTDEQRKIIDSIRPDGCHRVEYLLGFASILETELTAVTDQRDRLAEEADKWEQIAHDKLSEVCRQIEKTRAVTKQRDELLRYNEAYREDHMICANCDAISIKEYKQAIEQRDRLAEACKLLMAIVGEPNSSVDSCWASEDEMDAAWNMGNEALAAAKGGSHES